METLDTVRGWFTRSETFYLLGAGCSQCAKKPLIGELTRQVVADLPPKLKTTFENLKGPSDRAPTIEDLMTYLSRMLDLMSSMKQITIQNITADDIANGIAEIRKGITRAIGYDWLPSETHSRFLQRIALPRGYRDVFTLNYDTVIEASLESQRISYIDGFRGTENAHFEPSVYVQTDKSDGPTYRLYKLHGSINWIRDGDGYVRRRPLKAFENADTLPSMVYPSELKYIETQFGAYETLMKHFRDRMRDNIKNNTLISMGYSFNDEHINNAILDAIAGRDCYLTIIAFSGIENEILSQSARLTDLATRCPTQINFFVGSATNGFFIGDALEKDGSNEVLAKELWKFENVTRFLCGNDAND